jgi:hypothetical protein
MTDYSFNLIMKKYCGFPVWLPVKFYMEHGWTAGDEATPSDLVVKTKFMLVFSKRREIAWKQKSNVPVYVMGAPFVHYRRLNRIEIKQDAKGTIAFPAHSCASTEIAFDVEKYCKALNSLDEIFKPVTICVHSDDVNLGTDKVFNNLGFKTVSAGDRFNIENPAKFYEILSNHQFATSNEPGSYAFYAVELRIPFFIYGELPVSKNLGNNPDIPSSATVLNYNNGTLAYNIFNTGPICTISKSQKEFVSSELGLDCFLNKYEIKKYLWASFDLISFLIFVFKYYKWKSKQGIKSLLAVRFSIKAISVNTPD